MISRPAMQREDHDRDVDEEHRAPPEVGQQPAADDRADPDPQAGHAGPDADRATALLGGEHVREDRQRRGHDQRAADAHQGAGEDQGGGRARERRGHRAEAEDHEAEARAPSAGRTCPRGSPRSAGDMRTRGCRRRRSTGAGCSTPPGPARAWGSRRSGSCCRARSPAATGTGPRGSTTSARSPPRVPWRSSCASTRARDPRSDPVPCRKPYPIRQGIATPPYRNAPSEPPGRTMG